MKEKMRKVRYPMLIVWGIFMGAAGTAGVRNGKINIKVQFRNFRYFKSSRRACGVGILGKTKWY